MYRSGQFRKVAPRHLVINSHVWPFYLTLLCRFGELLRSYLCLTTVALFFGSEGDDDAIWRSKKHRKLNRLFPSRPDKTTHCSCDQTTRKILFSLWFCLCHPLTWHGLKVMLPGILLGVTEKVPNGIARSWDIYTLW